jgi:hypothetical protein
MGSSGFVETGEDAEFIERLKCRDFDDLGPLE